MLDQHQMSKQFMYLHQFNMDIKNDKFDMKWSCNDYSMDSGQIWIYSLPATDESTAVNSPKLI